MILSIQLFDAGLSSKRAQDGVAAVYFLQEQTFSQ